MAKKKEREGGYYIVQRFKHFNKEVAYWSDVNKIWQRVGDYADFEDGDFKYISKEKIIL